MPWSRLLFMTGVVLILLPCLGLMSSLIYFKAQQSGVLSRWESLGEPPENGIKIVTGDIDVVYVLSLAALLGANMKLRVRLINAG